MTPELDAILDELVGMCDYALRGGQPLDSERVEDLAQSLSTNGWERHSNDDPPLSTHIEQRVTQEYRGAELRSLVEQIQHAYDAASSDASHPGG